MKHSSENVKKENENDLNAVEKTNSVGQYEGEPVEAEDMGVFQSPLDALFEEVYGKKKPINWKSVAKINGWYSLACSVVNAGIDTKLLPNSGNYAQELVANAPMALLYGFSLAVSLEHEKRKPLFQRSYAKMTGNLALGLVGASLLSTPVELKLRSMLTNHAESKKSQKVEIPASRDAKTKLVSLIELQAQGDEIVTKQPNTVTWHQALKSAPLPQ